MVSVESSTTLELLRPFYYSQDALVLDNSGSIMQPLRHHIHLNSCRVLEIVEGGVRQPIPGSSTSPASPSFHLRQLAPPI